MNIHFNCMPEQRKEMDFHFGNIGSRYNANNLYFTQDGKPFLPIAGELHFSRLPNECWERELLKMKAAGLNMVSTYVFWNYHEVSPGVFDFSGDKDVSRFLSLCKKLNMPCILRIGPWCHGEVVRGGFPKYINKMAKKRCDAPKYLAAIRRYWNRLAQEIKPYFDGETVIGVQLENEYGGKIDHICTLRKIAEESGFKTPFFTMTAWPTNTPHKAFLPMFGGYPEAPWTQNKKPLKPNNRFAISPAKTEAEIGGDLHKIQTGNELSFNDFPYASCELGPGNQVTQHRRPIIGEKDGYGVGFTRFASGMNWVGYYMYHGGRNPNDQLMQESRITGYPNNYPIIDYDFQSPLSRYGICRPHGHRLRLLHLFTQHFDSLIASKQAFFPVEQRKGPADVSLPSCSIRMDENGAGYFFVSTYERGLTFPDFQNVQAEITWGGKPIVLPKISIKSGSLFFYPFNLPVENVMLDYIMAQPIAKVKQGDKTVYYFMEIKGIAPKLSIGGKINDLPLNAIGFETGNSQIIVLSKEKAMQFYLLNGCAVLTDGTAYAKEHEIFCESTGGICSVDGQVTKIDKISLIDAVTLEITGKAALPHGYYLYSYGKRQYFKLKIDKDILKDRFDVELAFAFHGLNLQVFSGGQLINDYFNTDGKWVMRLREYRKYIERDGEFIIKAVPCTRHGAGNVYNEIDLQPGECSLSLLYAEQVQLKTISSSERLPEAVKA